MELSVDRGHRCSLRGNAKLKLPMVLFPLSFFLFSSFVFFVFLFSPLVIVDGFL